MEWSKQERGDLGDGSIIQGERELSAWVPGCAGRWCNKALGSSAHDCSQVLTCTTANALFAW